MDSYCSEYTRVYKEYSAKWVKDTTDFQLQNVLYPMHKTCPLVKVFCQISKKSFTSFVSSKNKTINTQTIKSLCKISIFDKIILSKIKIHALV